jgi:hypothetical protein
MEETGQLVNSVPIAQTAAVGQQAAASTSDVYYLVDCIYVDTKRTEKPFKAIVWFPVFDKENLNRSFKYQQLAYAERFAPTEDHWEGYMFGISLQMHPIDFQMGFLSSERRKRLTGFSEVPKFGSTPVLSNKPLDTKTFFRFGIAKIWRKHQRLKTFPIVGAAAVSSPDTNTTTNPPEVYQVYQGNDIEYKVGNDLQITLKYICTKGDGPVRGTT